MSLSIDFTDKSVSYETFIKDFTAEFIKQLNDSKQDKEQMSQNQAFLIFGKANVLRWKKLGLVEPIKRGNKIEYRSSELRRLQNKAI